MPHSITTLSAILDDARQPLQNIIGELVRAREWAKVSARKTGGKSVKQPVVIADDTGMGWISDGGSIATAAGGDPIELDIPYRYFAGRWRVTGPTIEAAGESKSQLTDAAEFASTQLVDSADRILNRATFSGNTCYGFISERKSDTAKLWEMSGDVAKLAADIATVGGPVDVTIVRMDTYATIGTVAVSVANATTGLITIDDALDTTGVSSEYGCAVIYAHDTAHNLEGMGVYGNLALPTHFGIDRTTATATAALLQSNVLTIHTSAGADKRTAPTLARLQNLLDLISERTRGGRPNRCFYHPAQGEGLQTLLQGATTMQVDITNGAKKVDAGMLDGFHYNGIKFEPDPDMGKGILAFLHDNTWNSYMLRKGDFDDRNGQGPLYTVQGSDAVEAVWKEYQNLGCFGPNYSGAVVGLNFPGAGDGTT